MSETAVTPTRTLCFDGIEMFWTLSTLLGSCWNDIAVVDECNGSQVIDGYTWGDDDGVCSMSSIHKRCRARCTFCSTYNVCPSKDDAERRKAGCLVSSILRNECRRKKKKTASKQRVSQSIRQKHCNALRRAVQCQQYSCVLNIPSTTPCHTDRSCSSECFGGFARPLGESHLI
jgi:hypothetical protein